MGHEAIVIDERARWRQQRTRRFIGLGVGGVVAIALVVAIITQPDWLTGELSFEKVGELLSNVWHGWVKAVLNPWYWLLIPVLLVLERLFPAQERGGMVSVGGALDLIWIAAAPFINLTIVAGWAAVLNLAYDTWFDGAEVDLASAIGIFPTALVAFVLSDFLMWFTHWMRHKVPTFWYFHAVHHAAPTLNALTDNRVHFVEGMIAATLVVLPTRWLGLDGPAAVALTIATTYFTAFTHTAVRWNLGPLRYILVTPQSHRVHHSYAPEHIDTNFATVFSFWDIIFRTQYFGWDEYPTTGIHDEEFPLEQKPSPGALVRCYGRQVVYPFVQVARDVGKFRHLRAPDP